MTQTITISINQIWQPSESKILGDLRGILPASLQILSLDRGLFSGRYTVTVENTGGFSRQNIVDSFLWALEHLGYVGEVIAIDDGEKSSAPGGISQALGDTVKDLSGPLAGVAVVAASAAFIAGLIYFGPIIKKGLK